LNEIKNLLRRMANESWATGIGGFK
jgi:hypothetical protein